MRWLRKNRWKLVIAIACAGTVATALVVLIDGKSEDIFLSAFMSACALLYAIALPTRPRDYLMYAERPPTTLGWPSPRITGLPWGPKIPDDYDERNS